MVLQNIRSKRWTVIFRIIDMVSSVISQLFNNMTTNVKTKGVEVLAFNLYGAIPNFPQRKYLNAGV
jgi:hypothetical protein